MNKSKFHARFAVLTVAVVSNSAVSDFDLSATEVALAKTAHSRKLIILADHSKFNKQGIFAVAPMEDIDYLVTARKPDATRDNVYAHSSLKLLYNS